MLLGVYPYPPPPPPSILRIMDLARISSQNIPDKGLIAKIFRNKDLACQKPPKMVSGSFEGRLDGRILKLPQSDFYFDAYLAAKSRNSSHDIWMKNSESGKPHWKTFLERKRAAVLRP
jgi:hypothetical protein